MPGFFTTFTNCRLCIGGKLIEGERLVVSVDSGKILESTGFIGGEIVDLDDAIIAPGFLELQTNGVNGFHFTQFDGDEAAYSLKLKDTAQFYATQGITGFWATIPTVSAENYHKIFPSLSPRTYDDGASMFGIHAEGPYLHPSKNGAHNAELFEPIRTSLSSVYGSGFENVKLLTLAPELPEAELLIRSLVSTGVQVSLGHSTATYEQGLEGLQAGANCLTHVLNCMPALHHRNPGLAGLITLPPSGDLQPPYYSVIADGHHVHPSVVSLLHKAAPERCILISDSIELAGLEDGTYAGHAQIPQRQVKKGGRTTIEGTDTLVGASSTVNEGVKNLINWSESSVAEAVRCVTENVADMMHLKDVGKLEEGRRADFVVLDDDGNVLETWIGAKQVWRAEGREPPY